jgi:hypothetical protein
MLTFTNSIKRLKPPAEPSIDHVGLQRGFVKQVDAGISLERARVIRNLRYGAMKARNAEWESENGTRANMEAACKEHLADLLENHSAGYPNMRIGNDCTPARIAVPDGDIRSCSSAMGWMS